MNDQKIDVFLAGVIQGSQAARAIESQDYRERLKEIFAAKMPELNVYCPYSNHSSSIEYTDEEGRKCFLDHLEMAKNARLLIAYLPEASLGTSIELWECHNNGVPVIAISPMAHNWVLRFFTDLIIPGLDEFEDWLSKENIRPYLK